MNTSLPDFLIIGSAKCGTTSLYNTLLRHDDIIGPVDKELQFFSSKKFDSGIEYYKSLFPEKQSHQLLCEASPQYHSDKQALRRIKDTFGNNIKMIFILRNPVDRFISQYYHFRAKNIIMNNESLFEKMVADSKTGLNPKNWVLKRWLRENILFKELVNNTQNNNCYFRRGEYITSLEEIEKLFEKSSLHLIIFDDMIDNPQNELDKIFDFLNIKRQTIPFKKQNTRETWRSLADVSAEIDDDSINVIREYYKPFNERLCKYLGRDLSW